MAVKKNTNFHSYPALPQPKATIAPAGMTNARVTSISDMVRMPFDAFRETVAPQWTPTALAIVPGYLDAARWAAYRETTPRWTLRRRGEGRFGNQAVSLRQYPLRHGARGRR